MGVVEALMVAGILALLGLEGFFSGSELALVSADRGKLRRRAEEGQAAAQYALDLLASPHRLLTATLLGTNLSVVSSSMLANELAARLLGPARAATSALVMIPVVLLFGEVLPKAVMRQHADDLVVRVVYPIGFVQRLLAPLVIALSAVVRVLTFLAGSVLGARKLPEVTREELELLAKVAEARGLATSEEGEIIRRLLLMSDRNVREIMVPVTDVVSAARTRTPRDVARLARDMGFSRVFIHDGGAGNIVGFVHAMDLLGADPDAADVSPLVREVAYVPEQARLSVLLREFLEQKREVAVVVDEYGATTGLVSMEDVVEVIVGQISDEFDRARGPQLEVAADGAFVVDARLHVDELRRRGLVLPDDAEGAATVSGLLMNVAQRVPRTGDVFDAGNARWEVLSASDRRVRRVRVTLSPDRTAEA